MSQGPAAWQVPSHKFSMDQLSPTANSLCFALSGLHLLLNAICLPVSSINFLLILRTAILHRNLKFLLLLQCLTIGCFSSSELVRTVQKFLLLDFFFWDPIARVLLSLSLLCMLLIDWLSFGLLAERILATIRYRNYEQERRPHFLVGTFLILCTATCLCFYSTVDFDQQSGIHPAFLTICEVYACLGLSFLCVLAGLFLWKYNKGKYRKLAFGTNRQNCQEELSHKYQLSENIRTNRQLLPSGLLHFVNVLLTISFSLLAFYGISTQSAGWSLLCITAVFLLYSLSNIFIQISIITMHPLLRRKLYGHILRMRRRMRGNRIGQLAGGNAMADGKANAQNAAEQRQPMDIFGNELIPRENVQMEEHFHILDKFWN